MSAASTTLLDSLLHPSTFSGMTRLEILESFGYIILEKGAYVVALIKEDPEAFLLVCKSWQEAEAEAYAFLFDEVDPNLHTLPLPESFT